MSRFLVALVGSLLITQPAAGQNTQAVPSDGPVVVASGEGIVKRTPDRAWVQITAESRARTAREAQKLNADTTAVVLQKLRAGLPADAIQTRGYDLQPEFDFNNGRQTLRGYVARNSLEVRIDELARVGELLELAVSFGATSVGNVRFDLKDRAGAEREALRLAVEDARRRADAAAAGGGLKVDRIVRIEEHRAPVMPPRPMMTMAGMAAERAAGEPPIAAGELEIRANVTLTAAVR